MKPLRLHSDTIFSINSLLLGSAIERKVFFKGGRVSSGGEAALVGRDSRRAFGIAISLRRLARGDARPTIPPGKGDFAGRLENFEKYSDIFRHKVKQGCLKCDI